MVIGDPDTIEPALKIPAGALFAVRENGGESEVRQSEKVDVTAIREVPDPLYATPVPPSTD